MGNPDFQLLGEFLAVFHRQNTEILHFLGIPDTIADRKCVECLQVD